MSKLSPADLFSSVEEEHNNKVEPSPGEIKINVATSVHTENEPEPEPDAKKSIEVKIDKTSWEVTLRKVSLDDLVWVHFNWGAELLRVTGTRYIPLCARKCSTRLEILINSTIKMPVQENCVVVEYFDFVKDVIKRQYQVVFKYLVVPYYSNHFSKEIKQDDKSIDRNKWNEEAMANLETVGITLLRIFCIRYIIIVSE